MADEKVLTIHQAMAEIMRKVGPVAKALKNEQAGYSARSIDDIMDALHDPMADAGVFVMPHVISVEHEVVQIGRNQTLMRQATIKVMWEFHGPDGGMVYAETIGEALDSGDKATNKAMQAAYKYCLMDAFVIPFTGREGDADSSSPTRGEAPRLATRDQLNKIAMAVNETENRDTLRAFLRDAFGPPSRIPYDEVDSVMDAIDEWKSAATRTDDGQVPPAAPEGEHPTVTTDTEAVKGVNDLAEGGTAADPLFPPNAEPPKTRRGKPKA